MVPKIDKFEGEYRFLSNFWPAPILFCGVSYPSTEHAYQAFKSEDLEQRIFIAGIPSPGEAKRYARRNVTLRRGWDGMKLEVMLELLRLKFSNPALRVKLLATGQAELIEGNDWGDKFWGVHNGEGENWLGKLLMQVRDEIRKT